MRERACEGRIQYIIRSMSHTLNLYRLQQIDSQMRRAQDRAVAVSEQLENDSELRLAIERAQEAETGHQAARKALDKAEADVEAQRIKIEQTEASLYGGAVRNPKELEDLQDEAASLKRHLVTLEDRLLECMLAVEAAEAASRTAAEAAQALRESLMEQKRDLTQEKASLENELGRLKTEQEAVLGSIPQEAIGLYDRLREQHRGVAVSAITDNSCGACGSRLTLALVQSARSGSAMALCPSCGRILYGS